MKLRHFLRSCALEAEPEADIPYKWLIYGGSAFKRLEKEMATHSGVLAWRIAGTEEPDGLLSMGLHRVGHD